MGYRREKLSANLLFWWDYMEGSLHWGGEEPGGGREAEEWSGFHSDMWSLRFLRHPGRFSHTPLLSSYTWLLCMLRLLNVVKSLLCTRVPLMESTSIGFSSRGGVASELACAITWEVGLISSTCCSSALYLSLLNVLFQQWYECFVFYLSSLSFESLNRYLSAASL